MRTHRTRQALAALAALGSLLQPAAHAACQVRNEINIVEQVARNYSAEFQKTSLDGDEGWWFLDRLVPVLQQKDPRWGYNCKRGNCNELSKDAIAFNCSGRAERSTNVAIIDVVGGSKGQGRNPTVAWTDVTSEGPGAWVSSRTGARTGGTTTPRQPANIACKAPKEINIVEQVARNYSAEFQKTSLDGDEGWWFLDRLVPVLQQKDPRWGYNCKRGNCNELSKDAIAFNCSGRAERSTNVAIIDVVGGSKGQGRNPTVAWTDVTSKGPGAWVSSRTGARTGNSGGGSGGTTTIPRQPASARPECEIPWKGYGDKSCKVGTYSTHPPDTSAEVRWTCGTSLGEKRCASKWSDVGESECPRCIPGRCHFKFTNGKCLASCGHQANLFLQKCRESGNGCAGFKVASGGLCSSPGAGWRKMEDLEAHDVATCCLLGPAGAVSNPSNNQNNVGAGAGNQPQCYPGGADYGSADCI